MRLRLINRILLIGLLLTAAACDSLPIPKLTFATRTPAPPPEPTHTPTPGGLIHFRVRAPASTPAGAGVAVQLLDPLGGGYTLAPLTSAGDGVWTGSTAATLGRMLRYRYARTGPSTAGEMTPTGQPVSYRLFLAEAPNATADDVIAAWSDAPFAGDQGALTGVVRNSNTGLGVPGVIVSAGGQLTLTAADGAYTLYNIPAGSQRVTIMAPDGALRATQAAANVPPSQVVPLDLAAPDPNAVQITFVVQPPPGLDAAAGLRLVGEVAQLGDTFVPAVHGASTLAARAPVLAPLGDGRFAAIVELYEGTLVRYAYTLGDGYWNSELDAGGARRVREYVVPFGNAIVQDTVASWHAGPSAPVTFEVTTPAATPANDVVAIQFRTSDWLPPVPMWRAGLNLWRFTLNAPEDFAGSLFYRYCRNYACGAGDEAGGSGALSRAFTPTLLPQALKDSIGAWRWQSPAAPLALTLPPPVPHASFAAGLALPEAWEPDAQPFYAELLRGLQAAGANSLTVYRRSVLRNAAPPVFADDLALSMPAPELRALTSQARAAGLRTVLHPVTCAYTPYGACEYWSGVAFTPEFWNAWFAAYERHLLTQAEFAAQAGVEVLVVGDFKLRPALPGEPEAPADADARWRGLLARVRQRFGGQLAFEVLMGQSVWPNPPAFLDSVDVIRVAWWAALAANNAPTANDLLTNAAGLLDTQLFPVQQRFGKPLTLALNYYAADGAATQCLPRPDGPCHAFWEFNPNAPDLPRYGLDLAEQAEVYNAVLAAVYPRGWVTGVEAAGYNPRVALQDKSLSVRGKPAEGVLAAWFLRFQGR
ncbi:MAG: hypothetical protein JNK29_08905 [Anaerolineales bacterium]|nr:hypothetical protein [Anaerolineales bacterium]